MDTLRDAAISIVRTLAAAGHTAYLAGGCVRDRLLGIEPKDYDVATDATPDIVRSLLRGARLVGESFGVVMAPVKVQGQRRYIEVATFRREWGYTDGRRPDHVEFTTAEQDAQRRDFTVNGLFENPLADDAIIDHVGGVADLQAKLIRAIGDPADRFGEDFLRMLRAVRFAARLGFDIEPDTARAIRRHARYLSQISRERIGQEVQWMMLGPSPCRAAELMQQLHLDAATLNEDRADPPLPTLLALGRRPYATLLAGWMLDRHAGKHEGELTDVARRWRRALCLSNDEYAALKATLELSVCLREWSAMSVAGRKRLLAHVHAGEGLALFEVRNPASETARVLREAAALQAEGVAPEPWVSGDDLIALGRSPGPQFKRWLDEVYDAQLEGRVPDRDAAMVLLRRISAERSGA
jgi:tRNA nucleotidyltransferase/poly(A) polymerase